MIQLIPVNCSTEWRKNKVKMQLMSYPRKINPDDFEGIKAGIYRIVYHCV